MKKGFNILIAVLCIFSIFSCSKTKSYTDYLNDEKKEIKRLVREKNFEILDGFPENGVFKENQFVQLPNGIYLNVVDSGNSDRAIAYQTRILTRFSGEYFFELDTPVTFSLFSNGNYPIEFTYGTAFSISQAAYSSEGSAYYFLGTGLESALAYVGDSSIVKLIVPFKVGSYYQYTSYLPLYFDKVRFIFDK